MGDIHKTKKRVKNTMNRVLESNYSKDEKEVLKDFKKHLEAEGCSSARIDSYLNAFLTLESHISSKLLNPEKSELKRIVAKINNNDLNSTEYSIWSLHEFKKTIRKFYQYYTEEEEPELISFLSTNVKNSKKPLVSSEDLPSREDVRKLVRTRNRLRNAALIMVTFDSGGRIGEVLNVKWHDITIKERKKGKIRFRKSKSMKREIPIYESVEYLKRWHQKTPKPEAKDYVFVNIAKNGFNKKHYGKQMSYESARRVFKKAGKEIEANFKTNPHAFRKGKATELASKGLNSAQICRFLGWRDLKTARKYIRLGQDNLNTAIEEIEENKTQEKKPNQKNEINKEQIGDLLVDLLKEHKTKTT